MSLFHLLFPLCPCTCPVSYHSETIDISESSFVSYLDCCYFLGSIYKACQNSHWRHPLRLNPNHPQIFPLSPSERPNLSSFTHHHHHHHNGIPHHHHHSHGTPIALPALLQHLHPFLTLFIPIIHTEYEKHCMQHTEHQQHTPPTTAAEAGVYDYGYGFRYDIFGRFRS